MTNGTARGLCELGLGKIGREYTNTDYNLDPRINISGRSGRSTSSRSSLGSAFGGSIRSQIKKAVKSMAQSLLIACPRVDSGDRFQRGLKIFVNAPNHGTMVRFINWRNDQLTWADNNIHYPQLKAPASQSIRTWFGQQWGAENRQHTEAYLRAQDVLNEAKIFEQSESDLGQGYASMLLQHWL